jgi:hypothetical protein
MQTCKHYIKTDPKNYDSYCIYCHQIVSEHGITHYDDEIKRNQHYIPMFIKEYDRSKWNNCKLEYIRGDFNVEITDQVQYFILEEIPDPFTWYDVSKVFLKYKLPDYWLGFGNWLGNDYKCHLTPLVVKLADEFTETKMKNYRINYCYLLYKFMQLHYGHECRKVPMKGKAIWLYKMDKWWETICKEKNYEFKISVIYKFHWNKKARLEKFKSCIERMSK